MSYFDALYKLYPQAVRTADDCAFDKDDNKILIDKTLIEAEAAKTAYIAQRAAAYPSIPDQLDLLYHGGMDAWKAAITAVKEAFPK
jgi:hypothetical protein